MPCIPYVDYLSLDDGRLAVDECEHCGARYLDRRRTCASCSGTAFRQLLLGTEGVLRTFTIVHQARPGIPTPFVAGIVVVDGLAVRATIAGCSAPEDVRLGMPVRLVLRTIDTDDEGTDAVAFAFEPVGGPVG